MARFFRISDNSFDVTGCPWVTSILGGWDDGVECPKCKHHSRPIAGELSVVLDYEKGNFWPDALGCGAEPLLIVSARVLQDWKKDGVGEFPNSAIHILDPLPELLAGTEPPEYFWIDGWQLRGAKLDFDASGFVGVRFCGACGYREDDISATYDRREEKRWPYEFVANSWKRTNLFTTDLSPCAPFCTEAVVDCARRHGHTNFRFIPVEEGANPASPGLRYLD